MPVDRFSGKFVVKTRDVVRDNGRRDYQFHVPDALTDEGTQPFVDASVLADGLSPLYLDAQLAADATGSSTSSGAALDEDGAAIDCQRQPAGQATGFIVISAATGGGYIAAGTRLKYPPTNTVYKTLVSGVYLDQATVAVESELTGPSTNLDGGLTLQFINPPVGIGLLATVFKNTDGSGLSGGADAENDDDYRRRQAERRQNPPAAGNETAIVKAVEDIAGLAVQKGFAIPALFGPATMGVAFTMRPSVSGASRLPNGAQIALVSQIVTDAFPGDDGIIVLSGLDDPVVVGLKVTWKPTAVGWADAAPWPAFYTPQVTVNIGATASSATVTSSATITAPQVGQSIGLYNPAKGGGFARKKISSVTTVSAGHTYTLAFDMTTPMASDPTFAPSAGALVSPWSDSLNDIVPPILKYFDYQGPGEMVASFADVGRRQRRIPLPAPDMFPSKVENRMVDGLFSNVEDAVIVLPTSIPLATTVGVGMAFYLHKLGDLAAYPQ